MKIGAPEGRMKLFKKKIIKIGGCGGWKRESLAILGREESRGWGHVSDVHELEIDRCLWPYTYFHFNGLTGDATRRATFKGCLAVSRWCAGSRPVFFHPPSLFFSLSLPCPSFLPSLLISLSLFLIFSCRRNGPG